jgi:hypothetical protein
MSKKKPTAFAAWRGWVLAYTYEELIQENARALRVAEEAERERARREEADRKHAEDVADYVIRSEWYSSTNSEHMEFKAYGSKSGRQIFGANVRAYRSRCWSTEAFGAWEIGTGGMNRTLAEAKIYAELLRLAVDFVTLREAEATPAPAANL